MPCDAVTAQESGEFVAHAADAHPQRCITVVGAIGPGGVAARRGANADAQHPVAILTEGDAHALSPCRQCTAHLYAHLVKIFDGRDEAHCQRCIACYFLIKKTFAVGSTADVRACTANGERGVLCLDIACATQTCTDCCEVPREGEFVYGFWNGSTYNFTLLTRTCAIY